jgi:hypothetical protein
MRFPSEMSPQDAVGQLVKIAKQTTNTHDDGGQKSFKAQSTSSARHGALETNKF